MHILVTNDDGPPSPQSSPYVHCLVNHLREAGHTVSVCLPHTQRSWIGKAHMVGQTLHASYFQPSANVHGYDTEGTTHHLPSTSGDVDEWILIDGTPASCVQIGLYHFFKDKGPIDLVISGPNYGRNTSSVFALSSGTLGAALEAAVCSKKSIGLSFAFFSTKSDLAVVEAACRHSVRVIEALYKQWPTDGSADLYSVNVPLLEGVEERKTLWADILQNYWTGESCCFQAVEDSAADPAEEEAHIRAGPHGETGNAQASNGSQNENGKPRRAKQFKWSPHLADLINDVKKADPTSDGRVIADGNTSITPMKANFVTSDVAHHGKEFQFDTRNALEDSSSRSDTSPLRNNLHAMIAYEDAYVQPLIVSALKSVFPDELVSLMTDIVSAADAMTTSRNILSSSDSRLLQILPYESIDFELAAANSRNCLINSYMIRKALIRKHYLSTTVDHWVAKNPSSALKKHFKRSETFEVDYAEFLDDALVEAFDLRDSMDKNAELEADNRRWWILKPGMSDRGQGIKLFGTMDELQTIFDNWEDERPDSDDEDADDTSSSHPGRASDDGGDYITTAHLRHFVAQPYIHPPLLLADKRKFHIRTYVLCNGSLNVHVYKHMLALFAAKQYTSPWENTDDIETFLTNTCLQDSPNENSVRRFWDLPLAREQLDTIFGQICLVTGEIFEAAARAMPVHFQTLPYAFEVFGLDFMVDDAGDVSLLEVNAFPDFKQTGGDLKQIVQGFWEGVVREVAVPFFGRKAKKSDDDMVKVREVDLGRR